MAPINLEGATLGQKHHHYNKLVDEALRNNQLLQSIEQSDDDDIRNLLKIDIACRNKNVDYILEVLKSEDQLYVSKAIKRSTWLLTDPQYAHIINPEHLYKELYPRMTSKAFNKLMLNIRLQLRDEKRVEAFYNYIKEKDKRMAYKWLEHCSIPFIEKEIVDNNDDIRCNLLNRLLEKSFTLYESYHKNTINSYYYMRECRFLLKKYPLELLDFLESMKENVRIRFTSKGTKIIMRKCSERIINKFAVYGKRLHLATFARCLKKKEDIEAFLLKHVDNDELRWLYAIDKLHHFVRHMPKETRFQFVRNVFIDKTFFDKRDNKEQSSKYRRIAYCAENQKKSRTPHSNTNVYLWYKFAPFEEAYADLKKLIRVESVPFLRNSMLQVMLSCAGRNKQHIQTVLQYYHDKHINEPFKFKIQFVNYFISKVDTHTLDDRAWDLLYDLFQSMEVFIESDNNVQFCIQAIIVRNAIGKLQVPDVIENKFIFDTLKTKQTKLKKQEEKDAVFEYLQGFVITRIKDLNLTIEPEFNEAVILCCNLLNLIKDWGKELQDYPYALDKIKELIRVKDENRWSRDLSTLYNTKKSWRKIMFEESIAISPTQGVCVNALKHDPELMSRNKDRVLAMSSNDNITMIRLFAKMRIYWPHTLVENWRSTYLNRLEQPGGHKALVGGLCALLPQEQISGLLKKYAPSETKIDWSETDQVLLSFRKQLAKNIHKARPLVPLEGLLLYAKGDYMQHIVPSINALLSQLSPAKCRLSIPRLLDAPISLQKFGLRCAISKLSSEESNLLMSETWNSTKNSSIRSVLFLHTFKLLCNHTNASQVEETWNLLSMFIDKLTPDDNKLLFKKLGLLYEVPDIIKPKFFVKSYTFLSSLPAKCKCASILSNMQNESPYYMEFFDDDFVINLLFKDLSFINENDKTFRDTAKELIASFILASNNEETQVRRYKKCLEPILEEMLPQWETIIKNTYRVKKHTKTMLEYLVTNMQTYTFQNKMQIPSKTFEFILNKLEASLSYQKDYVTLTAWKLATAFAKILQENNHVIPERKTPKKLIDYTPEEEGKVINSKIHNGVALLFAKECAQYLSEDISRFGSSVYILFASALKLFWGSYMTNTMGFECRLFYIKCLLQCGNDREYCLMVYNIFKEEASYYDNYCDHEHITLFKEIHETVMLNSSDEVKMYFYLAFDKIPANQIKAT